MVISFGVQNDAFMSFWKTISLIGTGVAVGGPTGFGLSQRSKDKFDRRVKAYEYLSPFYSQNQNRIENSKTIFIGVKSNLIRAINTFPSPDQYEVSMPEYIKSEPFDEDFLQIKISPHLPRKCQELTKEVNEGIESGVRLINEITDYYRNNSFFGDVFEEQKAKLEEAENLILERIAKVKNYAENDELKLTSSMRRRFWQ